MDFEFRYNKLFYSLRLHFGYPKIKDFDPKVAESFIKNLVVSRNKVRGNSFPSLGFATLGLIYSIRSS